MDKGRILKIIEDLPDDINLDALIERLYVMRRLELSEEELLAGKVLQHQDVEQRMAHWLGKSPH